MRAFRVFVDALSEDYGPYLTFDFLVPNDFLLDERYKLKKRLNTLVNAKNTYDTLWENEAARLDKRMLPFQLITVVSTLLTILMSIALFPFHFSPCDVCRAIAGTVQVLCIGTVIFCWGHMYSLIYDRKLLESIGVQSREQASR